MEPIRAGGRRLQPELADADLFRVSRRRTLEVGNVFQVPVDGARFGLGQVVAMYGANAYFFALFEPVFDHGDEVDVDRVLRGPLAFLPLSLDAKFHAGHWRVVGSRPVAKVVPLPAFKETVGDPGRVDVVDFSGKRRRPARGQEADFLPHRKIVAPVRLENALRARHGLEPWRDEYAALEPSAVATTARLFG